MNLIDKYVLSNKMKLLIKNIVVFFIKFFLSEKIKLKILKYYPESNQYNWKKGLWDINLIKKPNYLFIFLHTIYYNYFYNEIYLKELDPNKRLEMQRNCFGGLDDGVQYAIKEADGGNLRFVNGPKFKPILEKIYELDKFYKNKKILVVQIGCSNGRKIKFIANKYPHFDLFGIDMFDNMIDYCNKNNNLQNLIFYKSYAHNIEQLILKRKFDVCIIFSSGSAQYIQPEHLKIFFNNISKLKNTHLIFCDGYYVNNLNNYFLESKNSFNNFAFHFTHNYQEYSKESGLILEKMIIDESSDSCVFSAKSNYYK